jgi:hypothetical protein
VAVRHTENAIQLIPKPSSPPTQTHRKAMKTLAEALTNAMRRAAGEKAREAIQQKDYLDWHTHVEALQQEFEQELRRRI